MWTCASTLVWVGGLAREHRGSACGEGAGHPDKDQATPPRLSEATTCLLDQGMRGSPWLFSARFIVTRSLPPGLFFCLLPRATVTGCPKGGHADVVIVRNGSR